MMAIGFGYGSEWHLLRWMGRHRQAFDDAVRRSVGNKAGPIVWADQHFDAKGSVGDGERLGLDFLDDDVELQQAWTSWWPQGRGIHNWDAVGWFERPDGGRELLLAEAKAHLNETRSHCKAKPHGGRSLIEQSLRETAEALGIVPLPDAWLDGCYQTANRLAMLHFLHKHRPQLNARLLFVYFVGDLGNQGRPTPQRVNGWRATIEAESAELGLSRNRPLLSRVHRLFLDVRQPVGWLTPDETTRFVLSPATVCGRGISGIRG